MKFGSLLVLTALALSACVQEPAMRPMDEVPQQSTLANGDREYRFVSGCVVILEPVRAVMKTEVGACELYHRDIALLYASGD